MALHNYLRQTDNVTYCPIKFIDCKSGSGEIINGEWRSLFDGENVRGSRYKNGAIKIRSSRWII